MSKPLSKKPVSTTILLKKEEAELTAAAVYDIVMARRSLRKAEANARHFCVRRDKARTGLDTAIEHFGTTEAALADALNEVTNARKVLKHLEGKPA